ncbi:hypothetical protein Pcac1_g4544 [Phytophthora cactorum]|uniref:Secreted protein n=1 Tax=Phytophthora cactorum TaxID=29920 RepID=A0A329SLP5_9STRA|nr:hypothetical protein Pcac1_g4544 [Phytophthora cactorum]KAG2818152.1 hypothetical protein PC112_g12753 [Phytophthora cactorum]KAG2977265.1 hypothetical protein PC118_g12973 [Phytophthora cactorum]RAW36896.1 hypothetical protein PC110_g6848 [Phytophthora cactorum]
MASRLAWFLSLVVHISVGIAADPWLNASPAFLQLRWPGSSLLQVSVAEPALVAGTKTFFTTDSVTVLSVRNATIIDSASTATYELLFLIGDPTQAFVTTVASATLNTTGLATALGKRLESIVSDTGAKNVSEPLWQIVTAFQSSTVTCQSLASADVLSLYKSAPTFPAIRTTIPPTAAFLTFSILFRNVNEPVKLSQSLMFQVRRGVAEFLGGDFNMSYVSSSGPATTAMDSTLQVNQTFYLRLPLTADTSMQGREALANRLLFGDLTRLAAGDIAGTTRPAMFLDFIFASNELSDALKSQALAGSQPFASTLIPYVFRYMNVDPFPVGNPALPGAVADTATLLATVSEDAMNALRRKKQRFQYDPEGYTAALPKDVAYPSTINLSMDLTGVFTTTVYWANTLSQEFWLESAESTTPVSWNLFPSTSFFDDSTVSSTLPAPIVKLGNTSTPLWTLQAAAPESLDMALNFRSTDDNSTLVKVEVAVTLHSSGDAESTVTSIARPANSSSVSPLNVVVRHQSRLLRNGATDKVSKLLLHLEFGTSEVTEKSADGCAHCQQLLDWCTNESGCAPLKTCVFSVIQNPIAQLVATSSTATDTEDLSSLVNGCLTGTAASPVDVNYLMLFTSAIRCHLRRLCPLSLSSSIVLPSDIKLVWGSGKGQQRIQPAAGVSNFPATTNSPLNISLGIGNRVVCYIPVWNNATAASLETKIARSCTFAKYLGTVKANVTSNTAGATAIDIFYDGLVGPLPTLSSDSDATQPVSATFTTVVTPSLRVRYVSRRPIPLAAATEPVPTETCMECKRLALDVCLRDAKCAAMADCVMQYQSGSGTSIVTVATDSSASSNNLADAILKMVRGDQVGTKLSLEAGVNSCLPAAINNGVSSVDVNGASWRKLVNASACYSRSACPLALAPVLSSSWSSLASNYLTVGKWGISPAQKLQKLIYTGSTSSLTDIKIPLSLIRDGTTATLSSPADPDSLAMALRALIQYDDIQVTADSTASSSWTISYGHWVGSLPTFIATGTKEWTLVGYPTIVSGAAVPNDSILELVPRSSTSTASANGTSSATSSQL